MTGAGETGPISLPNQGEKISDEPTNLIIKPQTAESGVKRREEDKKRIPEIAEELKGMSLEEIARRIIALQRREERKDRWLGIDKLTGLPGRDILKFNTEKNMAEVDETPDQKGVRLAFADLDDFGILNKQYGELTGDIVLRNVGQALNRVGREATDIPGRWAGEEFVMLMPFTKSTNPRTPRETTRHPGEHIRQAMAEVNVPVKESSPLTITASVGIATYQLGETFQSFFDRADRAMRVAKLLGKNRTVEAIITKEGVELMHDIIENKLFRLGTRPNSGEEILTCITDARRWLVKTNEHQKRYLEPLSQ